MIMALRTLDSDTQKTFSKVLTLSMRYSIGILPGLHHPLRYTYGCEKNPWQVFALLLHWVTYRLLLPGQKFVIRYVFIECMYLPNRARAIASGYCHPGIHSCLHIVIYQANAPPFFRRIAVFAKVGQRFFQKRLHFYQRGIYPSCRDREAPCKIEANSFE